MLVFPRSIGYLQGNLTDSSEGGWVLRHHSDQEAAESLLHDMHARTGWNMDDLIYSLREQWNEEAGMIE